MYSWTEAPLCSRCTAAVVAAPHGPGVRRLQREIAVRGRVTGVVCQLDTRVDLAPGRSVFYVKVLYRLEGEPGDRRFVFEHVGPVAPTSQQVEAAARDHAAAQVRT